MTAKRNRALFALALLTFCGCMDLGDIASAIDDARAVARIGVIAHPELSWPKSAGKFQQALEYFRSRRVDAIVILGNLTKNGRLDQYRVVARAWDGVFCNPVKGIDKNPPRRILVLGNRDRECFKPEFASELGDDLSQDGGEFEVNGFRFRATSSRPYDSSLPVFHADGKMPLTDELCWYPRTHLCVNAGSLSGIALKSGFEPVSKAVSASQGLLVTVYSSEIIVSRIDFGDNSAVADDWRVSRSGSEGKLQMDDRAPQFWPDTELRVFHGNEPNKGPSYKIVWPPVLARHTGLRAHSYEVDVFALANDEERYLLVKRYRVLSPNFYRSEEKETEPVSCRVYDSELPNSRSLRFAVTPISNFGVRGRTIESTVAK